MSIREIEDESHFQNELTAAGTNLVVVAFTAVWCRPCQRVAPHFELLASKYPKAIFLKVDVEKCQEIADSQGITMMPTFIFYKNGTKNDTLQGSDLEALSAKLQECVEGKTCDTEAGEKKEKIESTCTETKKEETEIGSGLMDLNSLILKQGCECLNECDEHPMAHCLIPDDELYLQSDCDEQLIISVSFNQPVKINGMHIKAPTDLGPKEVKIFTNIIQTLDFEMSEEMPCVQELLLEPKDLVDGAMINLRFVKFQYVQNIQLFVRNNQNGGNVTKINYIGFVGSPIQTTNMTDFKRVVGKKGEAH